MAQPGTTDIVGPTPLGTVQPAQPFSPEKAAEGLRKAMKGLGTNEASIISILSSHCNFQRKEIDKIFKQMYGRDLKEDLKSEISGKFQDVVMALMETPRAFDAKQCHDAIQGLGTDEDTLIEILSTRSNLEITEIRTQYKLKYKRELERDIQSDTSGNFRKLLTSLVTGNREERPVPDVELAKQEAQELYKAGEKKLGTDESVFNRILCLRSVAQLRQTFMEYQAISGNDIEKAITNEMSGNLREGCLAIVKSVKNAPAYFAQRLYTCMKGAGTKDQALIRLVVSRSEVDMVAVKQEFNTMYGKTLASFIKGDTSGDYGKLILALVGA